MKNKKIFITIILVIAIIVSFIAFSLLKNNKNDKNEPDHIEENYISTIYYSNQNSIDSGTSYTYYIYKDNKNYKFIKTSSDITIAGSTEEKIIKSGKINKEKDLNKIYDSIQKEIKNSDYKEISIQYNKEKVSSYEELIDLLYKE